MKIASGKNSLIPRELNKVIELKPVIKKYKIIKTNKKVNKNFVLNIINEAIKIPISEFLELVESMQ